MVTLTCEVVEVGNHKYLVSTRELFPNDYYLNENNEIIKHGSKGEHYCKSPRKIEVTSDPSLFLPLIHAMYFSFLSFGKTIELPLKEEADCLNWETEECIGVCLRCRQICTIKNTEYANLDKTISIPKDNFTKQELLNFLEEYRLDCRRLRKSKVPYQDIDTKTWLDEKLK